MGEAEGRTNSTSEIRAPGLKSEAILQRVMNTARVFLVISLFLVTDIVRSRTVYVINNRGYNYLDDGSENQRYFAPRRFLKISKRRANFLPDYGYDIDTMMPNQPLDNPFLREEPIPDRDNDSQFSRISRQAEGAREAEDYYNEWIMSNM